MDVKSQLDVIVERWNLLKHPFYQAWSAGRLPVEALRTYAREYGAFIARLPDGWTALGDDETAREEREHAELWADFAAGLDAQLDEARIPAVKDLIGAASALFADPAPALGALYAFEAQQPATAHSKLAGLRAFYRLPPTVEPYFEAHTHNQHEAAKLVSRLERLPEAEQERAARACQAMSQALWEALSGIYDDEGCARN